MSIQWDKIKEASGPNLDAIGPEQNEPLTAEQQKEYEDLAKHANKPGFPTMTDRDLRTAAIHNAKERERTRQRSVSSVKHAGSGSATKQIEEAAARRPGRLAKVVKKKKGRK